MTGRIEHPKDKIAIVYTFSGEVKKIPIDKVFYWNDKPDRVWGGGYKFKFDEEPFMVITPFLTDAEI